MTRKHVKERRLRNLKLGKRDREARCPTCLNPRVKPEYWAPYCSLDCAHAHLERVKAMEAGR